MKELKIFCWCECGNELCSTDSFVKDTDFVYYKCSQCGKESRWDFDAPAPLRTDINYPTGTINL